MSEAVISALQTMSGVRKRVPSRSFVFHRGDRVRSIFAVLSGSVDLVRHHQHGADIVLQRAEQGSVLAEASAFSPVYHCDAVAGAPSLLLAIPVGDFRARLRGESDFADLWLSYLGRQVQNARFRSEVLTLRTVAERLDMWLAWHEHLSPRGQWHALARQIGVSAEALYRELARRRTKPPAGG